MKPINTHQIGNEDPEKDEAKSPNAEYIDSGNAIHNEAFTAGRSLYARLQVFAGKFGVEQRGIERVPDDERTDDSISHVGTMWLASNMVITSFTIGAVAVPVYNLGFVDSVLIITFMNILAILPVCFFATFGPRFGLRQMVLSRFFFGYYGVRVVAFLNILGALGWAAVNVIVGTQLLHAVNNNVPGYAGILVLSFSTLLVCALGYRVVHTYDRYCWILPTIVFLIVLGIFAHSGDFDSMLPLNAGPSEAGSALSFGASVFGAATAWATYAADYTVYQPVHRSRTSVFMWSFAGLSIPLLSVEILGAAVATAIPRNPAYGEAYSSSAVGGLLAQVLVPPLGRFGEFAIVVLALSSIAVNCASIYTAALSFQMLSRRFADRVPRFVWTAIGTGVYVAIAIPAYDHFADALQSFLLLMSYWIAIYEAVSLTEHFVFRRPGQEPEGERQEGGYKPEDYICPDRLPPSFAAVTAFMFGIAGAILGMAQAWYTGPVGKLCGAEGVGGDVGFELAFAFTVVTYLPLRTWERAVFGR